MCMQADGSCSTYPSLKASKARASDWLLPMELAPPLVPLADDLPDSEPLVLMAANPLKRLPEPRRDLTSVPSVATCTSVHSA
jgi:hypothetical protein